LVTFLTIFFSLLWGTVFSGNAAAGLDCSLIPASYQGYYYDPGVPKPGSFEFKFVSRKGYRLKIDHRGKGELVTPSGTKSFEIPLKENEYLGSRIYVCHHPYSGDLVFFYMVIVGEEGWGKIVRLDHNTFNKKWEQVVRTTNLAPPVLEEDRTGEQIKVTILLSGSDFAGKLNLENGKFDWAYQTGLGLPDYSYGEPYREMYSFNFPNKRRVVIFPQIFGLTGEFPTNLIVEIKTGKILNLDEKSIKELLKDLVKD